MTEEQKKDKWAERLENEEILEKMIEKIGIEEFFAIILDFIDVQEMVDIVMDNNEFEMEIDAKLERIQDIESRYNDCSMCERGAGNLRCDSCM